MFEKLKAIGAQRRAACRAQPAGALWRAHGVWAPGVRVMRVLSMRAKMTLLIVTLAVPISLLVAHQVSDLVAGQIVVEKAMEAVGERMLVLTLERRVLALASSDPGAKETARSLRAAEAAAWRDLSNAATVPGTGPAICALGQARTQALAALRDADEAGSDPGPGQARLAAYLAALDALQHGLRASPDPQGLFGIALTRLRRGSSDDSAPDRAPAARAEPAFAQTLDADSRDAQQVEAQLRSMQGAVSWRIAEALTPAALSLSVAGYFLVCAYRVLSSGQAQLATLIQRLGQGNLSPPPRPLGRDEIGKAMEMLGDAVINLRRLFDSVTQGVSAVSHASREVARGNGGLSQRTGEIREAIGSVAGSARQSAQSMDACVDAVAHAREHTLSARLHAHESSRAMQTLAQRMDALDRRSREIRDIVSTMEALAFQTKLLSLNALVEAARAGVAGRGFSVVAHEVRALAERSEIAAEQIRGIIEGSVLAIEEGTRLAAVASESVRATEGNVHAVDGLMGTVVERTREGMGQSQSVLGIARNVESSMAGNVALIDQLSEAAASLRDQGDVLRQSIDTFVLA